MRRLLRSLASSAVGFLFAGCMGGQTGGEITDDAGGKPPFETPAQDGCKDVPHAIALYDASWLGFSGGDVLAYAAGTHRAPLLWSAPLPPVSFGPEQGFGAIELTLAYQGGAVRFVDTEPVTSGSSAEPATTLGCDSDRLEIEVQVRVHTDGGAFAETFTAVLTARSPARAEVSHLLAIDTLSGNFFVSAPEGFSAPSVVVNAQFEPQSFRGIVWGFIEQRVGTGRDASVGAMAFTYAVWPTP